MTRRAGQRRALTSIVLVVTLVVQGCSFVVPMQSTQVEGWSVSCQGPDGAVCEGVASLALNNLGRNRPAQPTGVITVRDRSTCPAVPGWADASHCWEALIPLMSSQPPVCMVIAKGPTGFGQVAGDAPGRATTGSQPPGCT